MFVCYCVPKKTGVYQRGGQAVEYVVSNIILIQKLSVYPYALHIINGYVVEFDEIKAKSVWSRGA